MSEWIVDINLQSYQNEHNAQRNLTTAKYCCCIEPSTCFDDLESAGFFCSSTCNTVFSIYIEGCQCPDMECCITCKDFYNEQSSVKSFGFAAFQPLTLQCHLQDLGNMVGASDQVHDRVVVEVDRICAWTSPIPPLWDKFHKRLQSLSMFLSKAVDEYFVVEYIPQKNEGEGMWFVTTATRNNIHYNTFSSPVFLIIICLLRMSWQWSFKLSITIKTLCPRVSLM